MNIPSLESNRPTLSLDRHGLDVFALREHLDDGFSKSGLIEVGYGSRDVVTFDGNAFVSSVLGHLLRRLAVQLGVLLNFSHYLVTL
jgi:hypothetical protein